MLCIIYIRSSFIFFGTKFNLSRKKYAREIGVNLKALISLVNRDWLSDDKN